MRGIRGATTAEKNSKEEIWQKSRELVEEILRQNDIDATDVGAAIFSATDDLTAAFPAAGARKIAGFNLVPLFDARQMAVDDGLPMCIRVLLLVDTEKKQAEIKHIYLNGAKKLRPDLL